MLIKNINGINTVIGIQTDEYSFLLRASSDSALNLRVYAGPLWLWFTQPGDGFDPANGSTRGCVQSVIVSTPAQRRPGGL